MAVNFTPIENTGGVNFRELNPREEKRPGIFSRIGNALISSEKKFGQSIGDALFANKAQKELSKSQAGIQSLQDKTLQRVKEKRAAGEDTSRLMGGLKPQTQTQLGDITPSVNKTSGQILGEAGGVALDTVSAGVGTSIAKGLSTGAKLSALARNVGKGAALGYGLDVTQGLQEGERGEAIKPGAGTLTGGILPVATKATGALKSGLGRATSELSGALTGQGYGGQKALMEALQEGGNRAKIARAAMRGNIPPEQIQQEAKDALSSMFSQRSEKYRQALTQAFGDKTNYDVSSISNKLKEELGNFKVRITKEGLDFSQSPIRFNKPAQADITAIYETMKDFGLRPGDRSVEGLDSLKRAFGDLYSDSGEARKFVSNMYKEVKGVLKQAPGYEQLSEDYSKSTALIKDIQKNLALGDKASIGTAYKRFSQILRGNDDVKRQLLKELDEASGGRLVPMIAGELASPYVPRGLSKFFAGYVGGGTGITTGFAAVAPILKAMIFAGLATSPRLAGEVINMLNLPKKMAKPIAKALNSMLLQFQATKAIEGSQSPSE